MQAVTAYLGVCSLTQFLEKPYRLGYNQGGGDIVPDAGLWLPRINRWTIWALGYLGRSVICRQGDLALRSEGLVKRGQESDERSSSVLCREWILRPPLSSSRLSHAPGYQQKFRPKIQFSKMFEINLKLFKSCTRWCNCDIENKILQKKLFLTSLRSYGHFSFFTQKLDFGQKNS